jgi:serine/threonine protein kinase
MICPRCSVGEISETTQECLVCGFSPTGGVMVDSADWSRLDDPVTTALERQFQVEGVLRRGAASRIYLARDQVSGRLCSLKVLPLAPFTSTAVIEQFRQDAQHAANLDHPHLVAVDRFGVTETALWYAMEYVQGRSLGDLLPTADRMELKTCLRLVEQVASALDYGHRRGMVHGNLKPSNVLVDPEGWARVADFGVNGAFGPLPRRQPELSYEENYGHVAPEQFGANGTVGPAADQYALAVLVFSCLARRLPFGGDTLEEITLQHLEGPIPLLAETRPDLPDSVSPALARAMSREPGARYASVLDFATALAGVPLPKPVVASGASAVAPVTAPASAPPVTSEAPAEAPRAPEHAEEVEGEQVESESAVESEPAVELEQPVESVQKSESKDTESEQEPELEEASAISEADAAHEESESPAEEAPAHPPLLFVERGAVGRGEADEDEDEEEDAEEELAPAGPPLVAHGKATGKPERPSREPVLLWRASREHPVVAPSAAAEEPHTDGESPESAPPLLFLDKSALPRPKAWHVAADRALRVMDSLGTRWRALPRNMRIGSGAGAGVMVLLLAVVWWRVARGHAEQPTWGETPPQVQADSTVAPRPEPPVSTRQPRPSTPRVTVTNPPSAPASQGSPPTAVGDSSTSTATKPRAAAGERAHLVLNATPWAYVLIDGDSVGHTPMPDFLIAPGSHVLKITRDGYFPYEREFAVEAGETLRLTDIVLQEKPQ